MPQPLKGLLHGAPLLLLTGGKKTQAGMPANIAGDKYAVSLSKNLCLAQKNKFLMRELTTPIRSNIRFRKSPLLKTGGELRGVTM